MAKTLRKPFSGNYPVTQLFGVNRDKYLRFGLQGHNGVDYGLSSGTPVLSAVTGTVVVPSEDQGGYGNFVRVLDLDQKIETLYAHLSSILVSDGQVVQAGEQIGVSGSSGFSTGQHLHFGVREIDESLGVVNSGNGFSGYLNPLGSEFTFSEGTTEPPQGAPKATTAKSSTPRTVTFDMAFPVLYKGWDRTAAEANFKDTGGKDKAGYAELAGISTPPPSPPQKPPVRPFNKYDTGIYFIIPEYNGASLPQIEQSENKKGKTLGNLNNFAAYLGIPGGMGIYADVPFTTRDIPSAAIPNSVEFQGFLRIFRQLGQPEEPAAKPPTPATAPTGSGEKWSGKKAPNHRDIYNLIVDLLGKN